MSASSGAIRAGRAFVEFFAEKSPFVRGLRSMEKDFMAFGSRVAKIGSAIGAVGLAVAGALLPIAKSFATIGDSLSKMQQRTGASVEGLSTLQYAAESCGASLGDVESALTKVRSDLAEFARGNFAAADGLMRLGVNARQLARLATEDQFVFLADRISRIRDPLLQAAAATTIFGGAGAKLLPLIKQGSAGMAQMRDRARSLGIVMSGTTAQAGEQLTQSFYDLSVATRGLWNQIGAALTPDLIALSNQTAEYLAQAGAWVGQNKELVVLVAKLAIAVAAVGTVIGTVGTAFWAAGLVFGKLAGAALAVRGGLLLIAKAVSFLFGPWGMLFRLVTTATAAFFQFTEVGQGMATSIGKAFASLAGDATTAWGGIVDAIATGDFQAAADIAFGYLKLTWLKVTTAIQQIWDGVVKTLKDRFDLATAGFRTSMVDAWATIQSAAVIATAAMADAWDYLTTFLQNAWHSSGVEYLVRFLQEEWAAAVSDMQTMWASLVDTAVTAWNSIDEYSAAAMEAIQTGVQWLADAWAIAVEGMQTGWAMLCDTVVLLWEPVKAALQVAFDIVAGLWSGMTWAMGGVWQAFVDTLGPYLQPFVDAFNSVASYLRGVFTNVTDFLSMMWKGLTDGMITDFRGAQAWIAKGIAWITAKVQGIDPAEAMKEIDDQLARDRANDAAANAKRNEERDKRIGERAAKTGAELLTIEQQRQDGLAKAKEPIQNSLDQRQSEFDAKSAAAAAAVAKAQDDLEEARFQAARARKIAELEKGQKAKEGDEGVAKVAGQTFNFGAVAKQSTTGTFSGAAAGRLGGNDPMLRENQEQTRLLRQIANKGLTLA